MKIFTERLVVRSLNRCDIDDVYDIMSDIETARAADFAPMESLIDAESLIRHSDDYSFRVFGICEKGSDKVIGLIQAVVLWESEIYDATVGYLLSKDFRRRGYMTEVLDALCDVLFNEEGFDRLFITLLPTNEASLGVAQGVGFTYVEEDEAKKELQCTDLRPLDRYVLSWRTWAERHPNRDAA